MKMRHCQFAGLLLVTAGLLAPPSFGDQQKVYQTTDAAGNPSFSDTASSNAKQLDIQAPQTYPAGKYAKQYDEVTKKEPKPRVEGPPYTQMEITSPADQSSIRSNPGTVDIGIEVSPGPLKGQRLDLVMDGKPVRQLNGSGSITLDNVDRGTHTVQVQATDVATGQVVQSGPVVTFTLHRHSILQPKPKI